MPYKIKLKSSALPIILTISVLSTVACSAATAQPMALQGTIPVKLKLDNNQTKTVRLMKVKLSKKARAQLSSNLADILAHPNQLKTMDSNLPKSVYLGMNGEPVLDQGTWGTCTTFAPTGAIDALYDYKQGERVSQLCNLELGKTVDPGESGWDNSLGYIELNQLSQYGFDDLNSQRSVGCGGLFHYPVTDPTDNGHAMTVDQFEAMKSGGFSKQDWTPIWANQNNPIWGQTISVADGKVVLHDVKRALNQGYRVVFGTYLDPNVNSFGNTGTYKVPDDAWVMTKQIQQDIHNGDFLGGHEIIIDGYNNNACATYNGGTKTQCGLLRIRNSMGPHAGDNGDYFMSYDYFIGMVNEAYAIGSDVRNNFKPSPHPTPHPTPHPKHLQLCPARSAIHAHFYSDHGWGYEAIVDGEKFTQLSGNYTKNKHTMSKSSMFQSVSIYPPGAAPYGNMICNYIGGQYDPILTFKNNDGFLTEADVNAKYNQWQSKNPSQNFCLAKGNRAACPVQIAAIN